MAVTNTDELYADGVWIKEAVPQLSRLLETANLLSVETRKGGLIQAVITARKPITRGAMKQCLRLLGAVVAE